MFFPHNPRGRKAFAPPRCQAYGKKRPIKPLKTARSQMGPVLHIVAFTKLRTYDSFALVHLRFVKAFRAQWLSVKLGWFSRHLGSYE